MSYHRTRRRLVAGLLGSAALALSLPAWAQSAGSYPERPVRLLVGFTAGGGMDAIGRLVAEHMGNHLGQPVVVENRPGAGGTLAANLAATAQPDGYTLVLGESSLMIASLANPNVTFDVLKDFQPVGGVAALPLALVANNAVPASNIPELVAAIRGGRDDIMYATSGVGTVHHLAMEWLQSALNFKMNHVPYRGATALVPDVISGQVMLGVISAPPAMSQEKAGRLKVLGHTSRVPVPGAEQWPSMADSVPGFDASPNIFVMAPAGTPLPIVRRLSDAIAQAQQSEAFKAGIVKLGGVAWPHDHDSLGRAMRTESAQWADIIKKANVVLQ